MITIRIKTWSDYKKQLLDWLKDPRRETFKMYVDYMREKCVETIYKEVKELARGYGWDDAITNAHINNIIYHINAAREDTHDLINKAQPKSIL